MKAALIIPALNEEASIGRTLSSLPAGVYSEVLVVDNGSADATARIAAELGAKVVSEPARGYGAACLAGIAAASPDVQAFVFMDSDGSDRPDEAAILLEPIRRGEADLVIGSRELGRAEPGALSPHQRFGNQLAVRLVGVFFGYRYTDLGPFRAVSRDALRRLAMQDRDYGWTIEMQIKALRRGLRVQEAPVSYRRRAAGESKVSGNVVGSIAAGFKILWTVARLRFA